MTLAKKSGGDRFLNGAIIATGDTVGLFSFTPIYGLIELLVNEVHRHAIFDRIALAHGAITDEIQVGRPTRGLAVVVG